MTIGYEVLFVDGLRRVKGEPVTIKNDLGMTFGVHRNHKRAEGHDQLYVVSNIETGMVAGSGASSEQAISDARTRIREAVRRGSMARVFAESMRTREAIVISHAPTDHEATA